VTLNKAEEAVYSTVSFFVIFITLYLFLTYLAYCVCNFPCHSAVGIYHVPGCVLENWKVLITEETLVTKEDKVAVFKIDEYKKDTIHCLALNMYYRINCV